MKISRLLGLIYALVLCISALSANATTVTYTVSGTVTDGGSIGGVSASVGDLITGEFTYDLATPDSNPDPAFGDYIDPIITPPLKITLPNGSITFEPGLLVTVDVFKGINIASGLSDPTSPDSFIDIDFRFFDPIMPLASDALPTTIDLNDFNSTTGAFSSFSSATDEPVGDPIHFSIDTMTVVPIPSAILLFVSGLLGVLGLTRKKLA